MKKQELVRAVASSEGLTIVQSERILNRILDLIVNELEQGQSVKIRNFGTFEVVERNGYDFKNPKTNSLSTVSSRKRPVFIASQVLKRQIDRKGT